MSTSVKMFIFSAIGFIVFTAIGFFISPLLIVAEAFGIMATASMFVKILGTKKHISKLAKFISASFVATVIMFVSELVWAIILDEYNGTFLSLVYKISEYLTLALFVLAVGSLLIWLFREVFIRFLKFLMELLAIPFDFLKSTLAKIALVFLAGTAVFRILGIVISPFSMLASLFFALAILLIIIAIFAESNMRVSLKFMFLGMLSALMFYFAYPVFELNQISTFTSINSKALHDTLIVISLAFVCEFVISFLAFSMSAIYRTFHSVWITVLVLSVIGLLASIAVKLAFDMSAMADFVCTIMIYCFGGGIGIGFMGIVFRILFGKKSTESTESTQMPETFVNTNNREE